jgi:hypothetical protein
MAKSESVAKVTRTIEEERARFEEWCRSLSAEELERMVPPDKKWSVKDFAAHLGTLDTELIRWFDGVAAGVPDETVRNADGSPFDVDEWNDRIVAERHNWSLDQIFAEAAENRKRLIASLEKLTDANIDSVVHFAGDNKRGPADVPLKFFLSGWTRHDAIHVADMLKALPEHADDPAIKEWLNHPAVTWYQNAMAGPAVR